MPLHGTHSSAHCSHRGGTLDRPGTEQSHGGMQFDFQYVMTNELALIRRQLDELSSAQTAMTSAMGKISKNLASMFGTSRASDHLQSTVTISKKVDIDEEAARMIDVEYDIAKSDVDMARKREIHEIDEVERKTCATNIVNPFDTHTPALQVDSINLGIHLDTTMEEQERERDLQELKRLIRINDDVLYTEAEAKRKFKSASLIGKYELLSPAYKEMVVDGVVAFVIITNAIFIGVSADNWSGEIDIYCFIDIVFSMLFCSELLIKSWILGFRGYLCGQDMMSNLFDVTLVSLDTLQLILVFAATNVTKELDKAGIPSASLFRIVRLVRITRILRLLRHRAFEDVLAMIEGLMGGATTLMWAIVLFVIMIYVMSLVCRSVLGDETENEEVHPYFKSVPRSMYTVFRCSFGDCSTTSGTPIPEFINMYYGAGFSLIYSLFAFFVTIGLFNVISAIFVDATMQRAQELSLNKVYARFNDDSLWATRVCTVVRRFLVKQGTCGELGVFDHIDDALLAGEIDRDVVDHVCQHDKEVLQALDELDIDPHDHSKLADILDPDHSGTISFVELVSGLHKLRGQPRRSDIVTVDLMLRATQEKLEEIQRTVVDNSRRVKLLTSREGHHREWNGQDYSHVPCTEREMSTL